MERLLKRADHLIIEKMNLSVAYLWPLLDIIKR